MQLPEIDEDTFGALLQLLEGVENRRPQPQLGLTYRQEKLLGELAATLRYELAAQMMPTDPPPALPKGVVSSLPPAPYEPTIFNHWDRVLEKVESSLRANIVGLHWEPETVNAATRLFYDICVNQHRLSSQSFPDLSLHVEPLFKQDGWQTDVVAVRLHPKTSMGRRYILSRQV